MTPWFTRADVARKLGVTRPRIHAMESGGQLPPPTTDPDTGRTGWPSGELAHLLAGRQGRQSSLSMASLPETATAARIRTRRILTHKVLPYRDSDTGHTLATAYTTAADGEVVLLQPLTAGRSLPQAHDVFTPEVVAIGGFTTEFALADAVSAACSALGYEDPYQVRWLALDYSVSLSEETLHEVIVETAQPAAPASRSLPWPFAVTLHELHPRLIAARLGGALELMPPVIRSAAVAEAWAAADWDPQWQTPVDLDGSVARALAASTLYGMDTPEATELAQLVRATVTERPAATTEGTQSWLPHGEDLDYRHLRPTPVLPATPQITGALPTRAHRDPHRLAELMDYARWQLDFTYIDGATPDPVVRAALETGMDAAEALYGQMMNRQLGGGPYRPRPSYWIRMQHTAALPERVQRRQLSATDADTHRAGILAAEATLRGLPLLDQPLQLVGECLALPVVGSARRDHLLMMAPSLGGPLCPPRETFTDWSAIHVHDETQEGLAWVEITDRPDWLPMPLSRDEPMTTGYLGTGPGNTAALIHDFLSWAHDRELTDTERGVIAQRTHTDKSTWITLQRTHLSTPQP